MSRIIIIGVNSGRWQHQEKPVREILSRKFPVFFRTINHSLASQLRRAGKTVYSFDYLFYQKAKSFEICRKITSCLIEAARYYKTVCYIVPGNPLIGNAPVERLQEECDRLDIELCIIPGPDFIRQFLEKVDNCSSGRLNIYDALSCDQLVGVSKEHLVITHLHNRILARKVKHKLAALYPQSVSLRVLRFNAAGKIHSHSIPFQVLDRLKLYHYNTAIYFPPACENRVEELLRIMSRLRSVNGCPWDRKQSNQSLRQYLIEEAHEVIEAIDCQDDSALREELGDLLLQVIFHSQIAKEENRFDFMMVVDSIKDKLIRRHPHVFAEKYAENPDQVKKIWEQIKRDEKDTDNSDSSLSVDKALPALLQAYKIQHRAADDGFDWPIVDGAFDKAREELAELQEAYQKKDLLAIEEEIGDYLFTIVNIARFLKVNPELALGKTINKFKERYAYIVQQVNKTERPINSFSLEELDRWWEEAKKNENIKK